MKPQIMIRETVRFTVRLIIVAGFIILASLPSLVTGAF